MTTPAGQSESPERQTQLYAALCGLLSSQFDEVVSR